MPTVYTESIALKIGGNTVDHNTDHFGLKQDRLRCPVTNPVHRYALLGAGVVFVGLGVIGAFLPLLPTTIFLLLAAACFVRSSERAYHWLVNHRFLGIYVRAYLEGKKMPLRAKLITAALIVGTLSFSLYMLFY